MEISGALTYLLCIILQFHTHHLQWKGVKYCHEYPSLWVSNALTSCIILCVCGGGSCLGLAPISLNVVILLPIPDMLAPSKKQSMLVVKFPAAAIAEFHTEEDGVHPNV